MILPIAEEFFLILVHVFTHLASHSPAPHKQKGKYSYNVLKRKGTL